MNTFRRRRRVGKLQTSATFTQLYICKMVPNGLLLFPLLLGCSLVSSFQFPHRQYYYVDIKKSWYDAQNYCRQMYTDLAIFDSMEEVGRLVKPATFSSSYAWIGLVDEVKAWKGYMGNSTNSWKWSATGQPSKTGYQKFDIPNDPNYGNAAELCVMMGPVGYWHDVMCEVNRLFVCFTETDTSVTYTYVNTTLSWSNAVAYCRQQHTDLVVIEDDALNTHIFNMKPAINVWIGLSRVAWTWADDSSVTFNNWQGGKPKNAGAQHCAAEDGNHQWMAAGCANLNPFLCHQVLKLKNRVTVNIQTSANPSDPFINSQILQKMDALLTTQGYTDFKLKWTIAPQQLNIK